MSQTEAEDEFPVNSVFHPSNFNPVVLIQLSRIYDVQMALLSVFDADKAKLLAEYHAKGEFATPPPAFNTEED